MNIFVSNQNYYIFNYENNIKLLNYIVCEYFSYMQFSQSYFKSWYFLFRGQEIIRQWKSNSGIPCSIEADEELNYFEWARRLAHCFRYIIVICRINFFMYHEFRITFLKRKLYVIVSFAIKWKLNSL